MNIEQKKKLAEWLGWEIIDKEDPYKGTSEIAFIKNTESGTSEVLHWEYNPDRYHEQFGRVWNNMSEGERQGTILLLLPLDRKDFKWGGFATLVLNDLPKVMATVLEVLEIK